MEKRQSVFIEKANKVDRDVLPLARDKGFTTSLVSVSPALAARLGVQDGSRLRVVDIKTRKSVQAHAFISRRDFVNPGLSYDIRESLGLPLDPPSQSGVSPLRDLSLKLTPFVFDIGLSFAGSDRAYVKDIDEQLTNNNIKVFFDESQESHFMGHDLYRILRDTYADRCEWCVVFASEEYERRIWTKHEYRAIRDSMFMRSQSLMILVLLQKPWAQSEILKDHPTLYRFDAVQRSKEELCHLLIEKLFTPSPL